MADSLLMRWGMPLWWPTSVPTMVNFDMDNALDQFEVVFQAREPVTITRGAIRFNSITGTSPTFKLSLQGVAADGNPDGVIKGGGSPVSKTFSPTGLGWAAGMNWLTFDNSYTCTRGEWLALVVSHDGGTIDGSNKMQLTNYGYPTFLRTPYSIANNAGVRTRNANGSPLVGWGSATKAYGAPMNGAFNRTAHASTSPDEWAVKWTLPAAYGSTYKVAGLMLLGSFGPATSTTTFKLYDTNGTTVLQDLVYDTDVSNSVGAAGFQLFWFDDATLADLSTGAAYRIGVVPQSTVTVTTLPYLLVDNASDWEAHPGGMNILISSRADAGTWTDYATSRFFCDLVITDLTPPAAGGGGGGLAQIIGA